MRHLLLLLLLGMFLETTQGAMARGAGGGMRGWGRNPYARRPWEVGYVGQRPGGRRPWDSDSWRRRPGGLSVGGWRPGRQRRQEELEEEDWEDMVQEVEQMRRLQEVAREQEKEEEEEVEEEDFQEEGRNRQEERAVSCTGMCRIMRMRTGK